MTNLSHLTADGLEVLIWVGIIFFALLSLVAPFVARGQDGLPGAAELDHVVCADTDCDLVLCYCLDVDRACAGTIDPGCAHPGASCCDLHRDECLDCRVDAMDDAGLLG